MKSNVKEVLKTIAIIIFASILLFGFVSFVNYAMPKFVEIYVINDNHELAYYVEGNDNRLSIHADYESGYAYILNNTKRHKDDKLYKINLNESYIIVKREKDIEVI